MKTGSLLFVSAIFALAVFNPSMTSLPEMHSGMQCWFCIHYRNLLAECHFIWHFKKLCAGHTSISFPLKKCDLENLFVRKSVLP
jgi:hypothetical protein